MSGRHLTCGLQVALATNREKREAICEHQGGVEGTHRHRLLLDHLAVCKSSSAHIHRVNVIKSNREAIYKIALKPDVLWLRSKIKIIPRQCGNPPNSANRQQTQLQNSSQRLQSLTKPRLAFWQLYALKKH